MKRWPKSVPVLTARHLYRHKYNVNGPKGTKTPSGWIMSLFPRDKWLKINNLAFDICVTKYNTLGCAFWDDFILLTKKQAAELLNETFRRLGYTEDTFV